MFSFLFDDRYVFFFHVPFLPEFLIKRDDLDTFETVFRREMPDSDVTKDDVEAYKYTFGKPGESTSCFISDFDFFFTSQMTQCILPSHFISFAECVVKKSL